MISWRQRVRELESIITKQQDIIEELTHRLKSYENAHTPSSKQRKKNTERDDSKPRFPGKPKGGNGGGIDLPPPDKVEEHKLDACPDCDGKLQQTSVRKHTVIDLPEKPFVVTEHLIGKYYCAACDKNIEAVAVSNDVYGHRLQSMVVMLKNLTNSHEKIASLVRELGAPSFSAAQVQRIADAFIGKLQPIRNAYLGMLRKEDYVHADETGFRRDGKNGYVWGVFTKSIAIFSAQLSRARSCINTLIPNYIGVLVSDGYAAYNDFRLRQRCWAHLLREAKDYATDDEEVNVQYKRLKLLYEQLKILKSRPPDEHEIAQAKWILNDIIMCLNAIKSGRKLATLITNGGEDWFTALYHLDVPLDNNHAERELRSVVLLRKTIGCYRNHKGKSWIDIVMSVIHTWKLQELNVFKQLCSID